MLQIWLEGQIREKRKAVTEEKKEGKTGRREREKKGDSGSCIEEVHLSEEKRSKLGGKKSGDRAVSCSQIRLVGEEAFRYDYHSFPSLVNI